MDDLINSFSEHLNKTISKKLGALIKRQFNGYSDYNEVETDIKATIQQFFINASEKELDEISKNIFNSFVERDDENIIQTVKLLIKIYSYYQDIIIRKKFFQWRININTLKNGTFPEIESYTKISPQNQKNVGQKSNISNKRSKSKEKYIKINSNNTSIKIEKNIKINKNIHEDLYQEGMRKKNQIYFQNELNELAKLNQYYEHKK